MKKLFLHTITTLLFFNYAYAQNYKSWNIKLEFNQSEVSQLEISKIEEAIESIQSKEFSHLRIYGYTDTMGNKSYNEGLSKRRTEAVYQLIKNKVKLDPKKVYYTWLGESYDTYDLHFDEAKAQTKSVDIVVYFK